VELHILGGGGVIKFRTEIVTLESVKVMLWSGLRIVTLEKKEVRSRPACRPSEVWSAGLKFGEMIQNLC